MRNTQCSRGHTGSPQCLSVGGGFPLGTPIPDIPSHYLNQSLLLRTLRGFHLQKKTTVSTPTVEPGLQLFLNDMPWNACLIGLGSLRLKTIYICAVILYLTVAVIVGICAALIIAYKTSSYI